MLWDRCKFFMKASEWSWVLRNMFAKGSRFYILMVATVSVAILMILRQGDVSACWHSGSGSRSKIRRHREPVVSTYFASLQKPGSSFVPVVGRSVASRYNFEVRTHHLVTAASMLLHDSAQSL